jgi:integrase
VFRCPYVQADHFFPKAVERARATLVLAGMDGSRPDGYTWHCNRHSFASRLVMAGVDLRTVQMLGGWRTLAMVQRYSHMAPAHLREAVERLVPVGDGAVELSRNYPAIAPTTAGVS